MSPLRAIFGQPMAAPETPTLRAMRLAILGCCVVLAAELAVLGLLRTAIGNAAGVIAGALLLMLAGLVPCYVGKKTRTDDAHLDALIAARRAAEAERA